MITISQKLCFDKQVMEEVKTSVGDLEIEFTRSDRSTMPLEDFVYVLIDTKKWDEAWKKDTIRYLPQDLDDLWETNIASKHSYGKNTNRKLNTWCKGILADSLEQVSKIRCSDLHLVNAAYTSQCDSMTHNLLLGKRVGERFYRENGDVIQADYNAAKNVLARLYDKEITLYTPFKKVRQILQERTDSYYRLATVPTKTLVTDSI